MFLGYQMQRTCSAVPWEQGRARDDPNTELFGSCFAE